MAFAPGNARPAGILAAIEVTCDGDLVAFKPNYRMADAWHRRFREAISIGTRYDKETEIYRATLDRVSGILTRLREARMPVRVAEEVAERLKVHEAEVWLDREAAEERMRQADEELRAKGESFREYQRVGVRWLGGRPNGLLGDDPGLGKTLTALAAVPVDAPVLVVCPALVKGNWAREIKRWRSGLRASILEGTRSFRWPKRGEVVIVNFDILPRAHAEACKRKREEKEIKCAGCHPTLFRAHGPECKKRSKRTVRCVPGAAFTPECFEMVPPAPDGTVFVVDEAHLVKNESTLRSQAVRALSRRVLMREGGRAWYLTGTPVLNQPEEIWHILDSAELTAEAFGPPETAWATFLRVFGATAKRRMVFDKKKGKEVSKFVGWEWAPTPESADRLSRVMLRRRKADVLKDLPPKTVQLFPVEIDERTIAECDRLLEAAGGAGRLQGLDALLSLQKVRFDLVSRVRAALAQAKIPAMLAMVQQYEQDELPLVVFSAHRPPIDLLAKREGWVTITGDTPAKERDAIVAAFQRGETPAGGKVRGIAGTIGAMGVGVTLTHAANMVFVDQTWTPSENLQAQDRCSRHGQRSAVLVTVLVAQHMLDERIAEILLTKSEIIAAAVDAAADTSAN